MVTVIVSNFWGSAASRKSVIADFLFSEPARALDPWRWPKGSQLWGREWQWNMPKLTYAHARSKSKWKECKGVYFFLAFPQPSLRCKFQRILEMPFWNCGCIKVHLDDSLWQQNNKNSDLFCIHFTKESNHGLPWNTVTWKQLWKVEKSMYDTHRSAGVSTLFNLHIL